MSSLRPDILLINVGGTKRQVYQDLSRDYSAVDTPFWLALTAGYLRGKGIRPAVLDANAENLDFAETARRVQALSPRLTAIICYSQQANVATPIMVGVASLCREIKALCPDQPLVLTGWHPSALPERTLHECACDYVAQGEGFLSLLGLLQGLPPEQVLGLWWRCGEQVRHTERAPNIHDLDHELPEVAWDLLPMDRGLYRAFNWMCLQDLGSRGRFASLFTSLGCPFRCRFCAIHATYGEHRIRYWSPEWVLRQLDTLVQTYAVCNINLHDELFVFNRDHYLPIAEGILQRGYRLNLCAFARVDAVERAPDADLTTLKAAGFNWFKLGIETGNTDIRRGVGKGGYTKDTIRKVVERIHRAGIHLCANFMFGLPGDTHETMQETLDFAFELKCSFPSFFCTMAIPGADLYREAIERGWALPDSWLGYASQGYDFCPLPTESLPAAEVLRFRDQAFTRYFSDPQYLGLIESRFGAAARQHIEGMTAIRLRRRLLGDP